MSAYWMPNDPGAVSAMGVAAAGDASGVCAMAPERGWASMSAAISQINGAGRRVRFIEFPPEHKLLGTSQTIWRAATAGGGRRSVSPELVVG